MTENTERADHRPTPLEEAISNEEAIDLEGVALDAVAGMRSAERGVVYRSWVLGENPHLVAKKYRMPRSRVLLILRRARGLVRDSLVDRGLAGTEY